VRLGADEEVGIIDLVNMAQNLSDLPRWQLARSAGTRGVVDEAFFPAKKQHGTQL
jgi:hypothetical protein